MIRLEDGKLLVIPCVYPHFVDIYAAQLTKVKTGKSTIIIVSARSDRKRVVVIGGGAAGMMAAGQSALLGAETVLLEANKRLGHKLSLTGKGRCNLTNIAPLEEFMARFGKNGRFLRQAFNIFFSTDLATFLGEQGVDIVTERGGRVFPAGENAPAVVEALYDWLKEVGVTMRIESPVRHLRVENDTIIGVRSRNEDIQANAVIVATGGISYPATGSTGDGYRLAKKVGHSVVPVRPALIPLITKGETAPRLQGLSLRNIEIQVLVDGRKTVSAFGEMLFTHYGLSGPIILSSSGKIVDALLQKKRVSISIDLKPALSDQTLDARLLRDLKDNGKKHIQTLLAGLMPSKLIPVCCDLTRIDPLKTGSQISAEERQRLRKWLKDFRFEVTGYRPAAEAIVTAGGISTDEIDPRTMSSRLVKGLYFAGETIDINGDTGGYNLQAAFSTGWLAGRSAAEYCRTTR